MKNKPKIRDHQKPPELHKNRESMDPFKIQYQVPGLDIPGFGKHYASLAVKGPMAKKPGSFTRDHSGHHDPCFWNRGGGRWLHTKPRGGQIGRQRERSLPRAPLKD